MENLIIWGGLAVIAWYSYKSGKRTGSRKGFNAGRRFRRRPGR